MNTCYDNIDETFVCQLQKIKCLFSDQVYSNYNDTRFGIKSCKSLYPLLQLSDLKDLLEYIETMDISRYSPNTYRNSLSENQSLESQAKAGCIPSFAIETLKVCNLSNLIEKINSL